MKKSKNCYEPSKKITVLVVKPGEQPYLEDIIPDAPSLERIIEGIPEFFMPFKEFVAVFCDCEGKLSGKPLNRVFRDSDGHIFDVCAGTFIVVGMDNEDWELISLSPDHIKKFSEQFKNPERFICDNGKLTVVQIT